MKLSIVLPITISIKTRKVITNPLITLLQAGRLSHARGSSTITRRRLATAITCHLRITREEIGGDAVALTLTRPVEAVVEKITVILTTRICGVLAAIARDTRKRPVTPNTVTIRRPSCPITLPPT